MDDILVRTTTPEDWTFINSLMKSESDKVGFLSDRTWHKYVWGGERNFMTFLCLVNNDPVGYVLLTPGHPMKSAKLQQVVIQHDARRLEYGTALVSACADFCSDYSRSGVALRCRADLQANHFWNALGFKAVAIYKKGSVNHMGFKASDDIIRYFYPVMDTLFDDAEPLVYVQGQYDSNILKNANLTFWDK